MSQADDFSLYDDEEPTASMEKANAYLKRARRPLRSILRDDANRKVVDARQFTGFPHYEDGS